MQLKSSTKTKHLPLNAVAVICITCESKFTIFSTLTSKLKVDVCYNCHPFYLGTQKFESKAGRVERFRQRQSKKTGLNQPTSAVTVTPKSTTNSTTPLSKSTVKPTGGDQ